MTHLAIYKGLKGFRPRVSPLGSLATRGIQPVGWGVAMVVVDFRPKPKIIPTQAPVWFPVEKMFRAKIQLKLVATYLYYGVLMRTFLLSEKIFSNEYHIVI